MAVPAHKRKQSSIQYIETMRRLAWRVFKWTDDQPKRYAFRLLNPMCQHAFDALYCVRSANAVRVEDYLSYMTRRDYLDQALSHLGQVETMLDAYAHGNGATGAVSEMARMITEERKLICGVKRRDSKGFQGRDGSQGCIRTLSQQLVASFCEQLQQLLERQLQWQPQQQQRQQL